MNKFVSILCLISFLVTFCGHNALSQYYSHSPVNTECPCCAASDCMDNCEVEAIPATVQYLVYQKATASLTVIIGADPLLGIPPYIWQPPE